MTDTDIEIDWSQLLTQIDADPLPPIELASILSNVRAIDMKTAQDHVHTAIDDGTLIEKGDGFGDIKTASYEELYLQARENSSADRAFVPYEDIYPVFAAAGVGDLLERDQLPYSEWIVYTPDGRDTPLYAYTPDLAGDTSAERETLATLLREAGVSTTRYINVHDGQKGSFDTDNFRDPDDPKLSGNYGVKGGRIDDDDKWLVDFDVDDYDDAKKSNPRVQKLRNETLGVASAHTTQQDPGHLYVAVNGDVAAIVQDLLGRDDVVNLNASFGEVRIENQYVVGPGSEIVCGCELCSSTDDHAANYGRYEIATEQPPVTWSAEEFREFLEADPAIDTAPNPVGGDGDSASDSSGTTSRRPERCLCHSTMTPDGSDWRKRLMSTFKKR
jgi:hypothetical protein